MAKVCVPVRRCGQRREQRRARGLVPRLPEGLIDLYGLCRAAFAEGALTTHVWRTDDAGIVRAAWVRQTGDGGFRVERGWMVRCRRNGRAGWARAATREAACEAACTAGGRA